MKDSPKPEMTDLDYVRSMPRSVLEETTLAALRHVRDCLALEDRAGPILKQTLADLRAKVPPRLQDAAGRFIAAVSAAEQERAETVTALLAALSPILDVARGIPIRRAGLEFGAVFDVDFPYTEDDVGALPAPLRDALAKIGIKVLRTIPANVEMFQLRLEPMIRPLLDQVRDCQVRGSEVADLLELVSAFIHGGIAQAMYRAELELSAAKEGALS